MYIIEFILSSYFGYFSLYSLSLSTAGLFYRNRNAPDARRLRRVAVLIPAYKEDAVIADVARQALTQNYPSELYDVVVIADSLKTATIQQLRRLPIKVVEVAFEKSTKVKALNRAMQVLGDDYDCALVLDADNIMEEDFIRRMNNLFDIGYKAIQARRDPKNENTSMALLDGLSETINNFIFRQGNVAIGWSASLNGSGMMFHYPVFKKVLGEMDSIGGFDRELELRLLEQGIKVYFARDIIVFDEKVASQQVFEHQRKRWISSHFYYLGKYFWQGWRRFFRGDMAYFNSSVLRNLQLPRLLNLGLLTLTLVLSLIFSKHLTLSPWVWALLLGMNVMAMAFAIPRRFYNLKLLKSIILLPKLFMKMFLLLFKLKGANKSFIHTPHGRVEMNVPKKRFN